MPRTLSTFWLAIALGTCGWSSVLSAGDLSAVKLNQLQVIGTHNSYHIAPDPTLIQLIESARPGSGKPLDYTHRPLPEQFKRFGIRQIELDVFADPKGGHHAQPRLRKTLKSLGKDPGADPDPQGILKKPGIKVLHIPDVDFRTTVPTFVAALTQLRDWSRANPRHVPVFVLVEVKDEPTPPLTQPIPFDKDQLDALDAEILSVFDRKEILTPDDVRGESSSLPEALKKTGWPTLDASRGKVMFALDNENKTRELYLDGHPASRDRLLFVSVAETDPSAAWMKINDPVRDFNRIQLLVHRGFLVRTRADADTAEARSGDGDRCVKALVSGAQFVSTDYPVPDPVLTGYRVRLPGGVVARCNPVSGDLSLLGVDLETGKAVPLR